ncbi:MAG: hypothetical protein JWN57_691 [Frankiales bacterium]|jgi:hypothetical protein|nr:hypothetical protein [Frankiales bacterium]
MTVRLLDQGAEAPNASSDGDYLLRRSGDDVEIGRVKGGSHEWLGSVPAASLPGVDGDLSAPELLTALQGLETALVARGG